MFSGLSGVQVGAQASPVRDQRIAALVRTLHPTSWGIPIRRVMVLVVAKNISVK